MAVYREYFMIVRNEASAATHRSLFGAMVDDDGLRLKLTDFPELVSLKKLPAGEAQYAIVPYYGNLKTDEGKAYANTITYEYAGDLLETIIHCPDGDVMLKDLNPLTGILMVGDYDIENPITDNDAGSGYYKNYLYDEDN